MDPDRRDADRRATTRQELAHAAIGILVGMLAVPLVIGEWTPSWFALAWAIAYGVISVSGLTVNLKRPNRAIEHLSSAAIGTLFAAQFAAALIFSEDPIHFWTATVLVLLFVLYTVVTLPFVEVREWRLGVGIAVAALVIGAFVRLHPLVALSLGSFCIVVVHGADRMRTLKKSLQTQLRVVGSMVDHDELTGLLNRRGLRFELENTVATGSTVVMLDVDRFKQINDAHGYEIGDEVLAQLGEVLFQRLPEVFVVGRQGGDEFVAIARGAVNLPDETFDPIAITTTGRGHEIPLILQLSAGLTTGPAGRSADRLLSEATFALREAKRSGERIARFGPRLQQRFDRSLQVASLSSQHSPHGRLFAVGQPIVSGHTTVGVEMLVRWRRPDGSVLSPAAFLPLAVENGMMPWINDLMLEHAVAFASRFSHRPNPPFVSVNITASHLASDDLGRRVAGLLNDHGVHPSRLMIEITESEYLDEGSPWLSSAEALRDLGVKLAVDDFGSGYSSVERLRHLPLTHLKFDRTLVKSMAGPFGEIVRGVARFSEASDIGIIAEGVESHADLEAMQAIGIDVFQGFYFGRPCDLDDLEAALRGGEVDLRNDPPGAWPTEAGSFRF